MPPVARVDDNTVCPVLLPRPHITGDLENRQPVHMEADGKPVIRLADFARCLSPPKDVVVSGSATVILCGLPIARVLDRMVHKGFIIQGSGTVEIGGPTFALPDVLSFANGTPEDISKAMRDLYLLSTTDSGKEMFKRMDAAGQPIRIEFYTGNNGQSNPDDTAADTTAGVKTGSTIQYNPNFNYTTEDAAGTLIAGPPTVTLFHEMVHSLALAEGKDQFYAGKHEEQAIGIGAHASDSPTENTLRDDLGLPLRGTHDGQIGTFPGMPPPVDLRPGKC